MTSKEIQICTNCVMDSTDPKISFDENGVCDHCNTFYEVTLPHWISLQNNNLEFENIIKDIKQSKGKNEFDCIIGMSGGVDSSYLTHYAVTELGLKPLVFHVDAGWNSKVAVNNIEKIVDKLGLDLFTEVIDWQEMKDIQLSFFKSGVSHLDAPQDHCFFAVMYKFANQFNVKNILTGGNLSTECVRNPVDWMYYQSDSRQLRDIQKKFGSKKIKNFPLTSIVWHKIYLPYIRGIKVLRPLDYIEYNKNKSIDILVKEYGWETYPQKHFESRFTKFYEGFWLHKRFGYDTRKVQFSSLILTNQMKRDDALDALKNLPYDEENIHHDIEYIANKLGVSSEQMNEYLTIPKKTYKDYRSQDWIYRAGSGIMKKLGLEIGGKR